MFSNHSPAQPRVDAKHNSWGWDGTTGTGQQMVAIEVVLGAMIQKMDAPTAVTDSTGEASMGNQESLPGAGRISTLTLSARLNGQNSTLLYSY